MGRQCACGWQYKWKQGWGGEYAEGTCLCICAGNGLGPVGGRAIGEALKVNTTLHDLDLNSECGGGHAREAGRRMI